jgi:hypothetical protein
MTAQAKKGRAVQRFATPKTAANPQKQGLILALTGATGERSGSALASDLRNRW